MCVNTALGINLHIVAYYSGIFFEITTFQYGFGTILCAEILFDKVETNKQLLNYLC